MSNLSQIPDDQLLKMIQASAPAASTAAPSIAPTSQAAAPSSPDLSGMSNEQLLAAIQESAPQSQQTPQMTGAEREVALPASEGLKGFLQTVGLPGDIAKAGIGAYSKYIGAPLAAAVTGKPVTPWTGDNPYTSANEIANYQAAGAVNRPDLVPQNEREKLEAAAAQGIGGTVLPALMTGGGSSLGTLARTLAQGAAGSVGSQIGAQLAPKNPTSIPGKLAQALLPLAGGLAGAGSINGIENAGTKIANTAGGVVSPTMAAYQRLGIPTALAGDISGSPQIRQIQAFASKAPGGINTITHASEHAVNGFKNAVEQTASGLEANSNLPNPVRTMQDAGQVVQQAGHNWMDTAKAQEGANWNALDHFMPGNMPMPTQAYQNALSATQQAIPNMPATAKTLTGSTPRQLLTDLNSDIASGAEPTWTDIKGIRSRIGEMLSDANLPAESGVAELRRVYAGLSQDMQNGASIADQMRVATNQAPGAVSAFNNAAAFTRNKHDVIDNVIRPIVKEGTTPEQAAAAAMQNAPNGGSRLSVISQQMPAAADALAAWKLRDMAASTAGKQNATMDAVSPASFLTSYNRDLSPEAHQALFGRDPAVSQSMQDLATVAGTMKSTETMANHSNTSPHSTISQLLRTVAEGAVGGGEIGGHTGAIIGSTLGAMGPFAGARLAAALTSTPALTRLIASPGATRMPLGVGALGAILPSLSSSGSAPALSAQGR